MNDTDARLWHPWLRINRVLRAIAAHAMERRHKPTQSQIKGYPCQGRKMPEILIFLVCCTHRCAQRFN